jgi:hypothetical protein
VVEQSAGTESAPGLEPLGIQAASTLCWLVGIVTIATTLLLVFPASTGVFGIVLGFVNLVAGVAVCVAAYLIRQRRRLGALVVMSAWAFPTIVSLLVGQVPRGNYLLLAATLMLLPNWKHLR